MYPVRDARAIEAPGEVVVNLPGIVCGTTVDTGGDAGAIERHKSPVIEISFAIDVKHRIGNPVTKEFLLAEFGSVLRSDSFAVVAWLRKIFDTKGLRREAG